MLDDSAGAARNHRGLVHHWLTSSMWARRCVELLDLHDEVVERRGHFAKPVRYAARNDDNVSLLQLVGLTALDRRPAKLLNVALIGRGISEFAAGDKGPRPPYDVEAVRILGVNFR